MLLMTKKVGRISFGKVAYNVWCFAKAGLRGTHYQTTQSLRARQDARI